MYSETILLLVLTIYLFCENIYKKREIIKTNLIMIKTWIDMKAKEKW